MPVPQPTADELRRHIFDHAYSVVGKLTRDLCRASEHISAGREVEALEEIEDLPGELQHVIAMMTGLRDFLKPNHK